MLQSLKPGRLARQRNTGSLIPLRGKGSPRRHRSGAGHHRPIPIGIRPYPNEHLRQFADIGEEIAPDLFVRTFTVVELDEPVVTGDEPVVVIAGRPRPWAPPGG